MSLYSYAEVLPYALTRGVPLRQVAVRAHAHLFGVGLVLLVVALLVSATTAPQRGRVAICAALFLTLIGDVLGQFLAKLHGVLAYLTWLSGWGLVLSLTVALGLITHELWFRRQGPENKRGTGA